jgi:hypothetical protein
MRLFRLESSRIPGNPLQNPIRRRGEEVNIREARESLKITAYPHETDPVSHAQGFIEGYESHKKKAEKLVEGLKEIANDEDNYCSAFAKRILEAYKKEFGE